ncbi:MAG: hypothetical protein ACKV2V_07485 [Blastocatellia bacterium]
MEKGYSRKHEMLKRVRGFGVKYRAEFPAGSHGQQLFADLDAALENIRRHDAARTTGTGLARENTAQRNKARENLRTMLQSIHRTARGIAIKRPGFENKFLLPSKLTDAGLLSVAQAFLENARPLAELFVLRNMPADFPAPLEQAIAAFENSTSARTDTRTGNIIAGSEMGDDLTEGMGVVTELDGVVHNRFAGQKNILLEWKIVTRLSRTGKGAAPGAENGEEEPTPPATVVPVETVETPEGGEPVAEAASGQR